MVTQLELTVVSASLELWSDKNPISTDGDADDVLQRLGLETRLSYPTVPWDNTLAHVSRQCSAW